MHSLIVSDERVQEEITSLNVSLLTVQEQLTQKGRDMLKMDGELKKEGRHSVMSSNSHTRLILSCLSGEQGSGVRTASECGG